MAITKQRVSEWRQDEVTRAYFAGIREARLALLEAKAEYVNLDSMENTALSAAKMAGVIEGLKMSLEVNTEVALVDEEES